MYYTMLARRLRAPANGQLQLTGRAEVGPPVLAVRTSVTEGRLAADPRRSADALSGIVLQEVLSGIRSKRQFADLERRLLASFTVLNPSASDYIEAGKLRNKCLVSGLTASGPDCLSPTLAMVGPHELFAADEDFQCISKHSPLKLFDTAGVA